MAIEEYDDPQDEFEDEEFDEEGQSTGDQEKQGNTALLDENDDELEELDPDEEEQIDEEQPEEALLDSGTGNIVDERYEDDLASIETQFDQMAQQAAALQQMMEVDPAQFDNEAEYNQALMRASAAEGQLQMLEVNGQGLAQRLSDMKVGAWKRQMDQGRKEFKDFEDVVTGKGFAPEPHLAEMIARMPRGYKVAYQLAKSPSVVRRLNGLSPIAAAMELGRMSAGRGKAKRPNISRAPKPVRPIRGGGGSSHGDGVSFKQLEKQLGF